MLKPPYDCVLNLCETSHTLAIADHERILSTWLLVDTLQWPNFYLSHLLPCQFCNAARGTWWTVHGRQYVTQCWHTARCSEKGIYVPWVRSLKMSLAKCNFMRKLKRNVNGVRVLPVIYLCISYNTQHTETHKSSFAIIRGLTQLTYFPAPIWCLKCSTRYAVGSTRYKERCP